MDQILNYIPTALSFHVLMSLLAVTLTFVGYFVYIADIIKGNTKPHVFTWLIFTVLGFTVYSLQVFGGGGVGTWSLLVAAFLALIVLLMSFWRGTKDIKISDVIFLFLSGIALVLWLYLKQPILSVILVVLVELLGFIPTVRKSWHNPYSEALAMYQVEALRFGCSILALQTFNILTVLYPATWLLMNSIFVSILVVRRKIMRNLNNLPSK